MKVVDRIPIVNRFVAQDEYTTKVKVWRRRGDSFQPSLHDAVRYKYDDRPNAHVLDTDEEIPAVPLEHIYTMADGTPYFEVIEVEDGQYAPREKHINEDGFDEEDLEFQAQTVENEVVPFKAELDEEAIEDTVIDNKDTRLNFWLDHLKESNEKYGAKGLIRENMRVILIVTTALSVAIIMYMTGDFGQYVEMFKEFISTMQSLDSSIQTLIQQNPSLGQQ